jgi:hypothetical protein
MGCPLLGLGQELASEESRSDDQVILSQNRPEIAAHGLDTHPVLAERLGYVIVVGPDDGFAPRCRLAEDPVEMFGQGEAFM